MDMFYKGEMIIIKDKRFQKLSEYLWQIVIILLGVISLIISFNLDEASQRTFATLNGVGVSLLLSGLLGIFMNVLFYRKNSQYEVFVDWKIKSIYSSRAIANLTIDTYQEHAKKRVDIIAFGLSSWRQANEQIIDAMLNRNVRIRIITMDPNCEILPIRDRMEGKPEGYTKESILQLQEFFGKTSKRKNVKIKYHKELPLDFYFRVDDHIFVGPYIFGKDSQQMITYEFEKGGKGFEYYSDYFESLWNGRTIPKLEFVNIDQTNKP